jgi:hypothetical protein
MAVDRERMSFDLRRGLWRLWLVATVVWVLGVVIMNAEALSFWAGYHYSLLSKHGSFAEAMAEKEKMKGIIGACRSAERTMCVGFPAPSGRSYVNEYDRLLAERQACVESPKFFEALVREASARGVGNASSIKKAEPCIDLSALTIPEVNWALLSAVFLVPALVLLIYAIGAWVVKGFARHAH